MDQAQFDPFDYLVPIEPKQDDSVHIIERDVTVQSDFEEADLGPIDILDLPDPKSTPFKVIYVILKLLHRETETNFGPFEKDEGQTLEQVLDTKGISQEVYDSSYKWLQKCGSPLSSSRDRLLDIQDLSGRKDKQLPAWLTSIVSCPLLKVDPSKREVLWDLASQVIGECSGRTARAGFVRTIEIAGCDDIKIKEPAMTEDNIGMKTWGSSLILARTLVRRHKEFLCGSIIELGSGTGLVGIVCRRLGYTDLLATDLPQIVDNLKENYRLNGLEDCISSCQVLDWSDPQPFVDSHPGVKFTTVILSDPVYSDEHPRWIQNVLKFILDRSPDASVIVQIPLRERFESTRQLLWAVLEQMGLSCVLEEREAGFDDFGAYDFVMKKYRWESA